MIVLILMLRLGMRQDASQIWILHVGFRLRHHWGLGKPLTKLRSQLQFFQVGWSAVLLIMVRVMMAFMVRIVVRRIWIVKVGLMMLGNVLSTCAMQILACLAFSSCCGVVWTGIHGFGAWGWIADLAIGAALVLGAHCCRKSNATALYEYDPD
jgi:hypothetical protein